MTLFVTGHGQANNNFQRQSIYSTYAIPRHKTNSGWIRKNTLCYIATIIRICYWQCIEQILFYILTRFRSFFPLLKTYLVLPKCFHVLSLLSEPRKIGYRVKKMFYQRTRTYIYQHSKRVKSFHKMYQYTTILWKCIRHITPQDQWTFL